MTITIKMNDVSWNGRKHGLFTFAFGRALAKRLGIDNLAANEKLSLFIPNGMDMDESFMKGFFGPIARKLGTVNFKAQMTIEGGVVSESEFGRLTGIRQVKLEWRIWNYLDKESVQVAKREKEKVKEEKGPEWSLPTSLYIPEIGTKLLLTEDWNFRLYHERRNESLCSILRIPIQQCYGYRAIRDENTTDTNVVFKAGTVLSVDRVYIRKGAKDFSSITFHVPKGAVAEKQGKTFVLDKGVRFWGKLGDVNKMMVKVDKATLAEN